MSELMPSGDGPHPPLPVETNAGVVDTVSKRAQLHLRLCAHDVSRLRDLARRRDQTLSATVRFLLHHFIRNQR